MKSTWFAFCESGMCDVLGGLGACCWPIFLNLGNFWGGVGEQFRMPKILNNLELHSGESSEKFWSNGGGSRLYFRFQNHDICKFSNTLSAI